MNERIPLAGPLGTLLVLVCSCASGSVGTRVATTPALPTPGPREPRGATVTKHEPMRAPLEYHDEKERDRVFVENAERAIGEYSEFIARAGEREEYASAVKRSRERIEDLRAAIIFVRGGSGQP